VVCCLFRFTVRNFGFCGLRSVRKSQGKILDGKKQRRAVMKKMEEVMKKMEIAVKPIVTPIVIIEVNSKIELTVKPKIRPMVKPVVKIDTKSRDGYKLAGQVVQSLCDANSGPILINAYLRELLDTSESFQDTLTISAKYCKLKNLKAGS